MGLDTTTTTTTTTMSTTNKNMKAQKHLLAHGPNFAIAQKVSNYCRIHHCGGTSLPETHPGEADELQAEVKAVLKKIQPPKYQQGRKGGTK